MREISVVSASAPSPLSSTVYNVASTCCRLYMKEGKELRLSHSCELPSWYYIYTPDANADANTAALALMLILRLTRLCLRLRQRQSVRQ